MAGFGFTEEQEMVRREVKNFTQRELVPRAKELAKLESVPRDVIRRLGEVGYLGITAPEIYGGQGNNWISWGIVIEELVKGSVLAPMNVAGVESAYFWLQHGSEELRQEWLPPLIKGERTCSWANTEPDAGSDVASIKTTAVRSGDYYILNGEKTSISLVLGGDAVMVSAKTDPTAGGRGISCFWVPLDFPGITQTHIVHTGLKSLAGCSIIFDGVRVPVDHLLGRENEGFRMQMGTTDFARAGLGLMAVGLAQISLEETIAYATQRTAFGKPIASFEGVSFKIAEHATFIEAARLLCYRTLYLRQQNLPHVKESVMCKWWCPEVAVNAIHDCLLIHGHLGYSEEYPLEQRLRDAVGYELTDGTAQMQKIAIARELMGRVAVPY